AERQHQGFFERASGGTLFLDEITEMPLELQVKLLRVLETGRFMRVGSTTALETDVRIVAATNRLPYQAVSSGKLREDLLYRLNIFPITLPPLRDRVADIPLLANHFLAAISEQEGIVRRFTPEALATLLSYPWPGNVRELRNVVQRAYVMAQGETVEDTWLPTAHEAGVTSVWGSLGVAPEVPAPAPSPPRVPEMLVDAGVPSITLPIGSSVAQAERALMLATLRHFNHHKERTAAVLGISLKTLYNRLKEYAAEAPPPPDLDTPD
ncbi:MAG TPA: sigma 54-interacting transcriptional regulator, partial [Roseateles sp.]|uniref:sigma 54-interacting transcriptional regulator n=1 Tax=Roseateles sp. TaxID=1971397 RepID=UPI002EDA3720